MGHKRRIERLCIIGLLHRSSTHTARMKDCVRGLCLLFMQNLYQCKFEKVMRCSLKRKGSHTNRNLYTHIHIGLVLRIITMLSLFLCISYVLITLYVTFTTTTTRHMWWGCPCLIRLLMMLGYVWLMGLARSTRCWTLTLVLL